MGGIRDLVGEAMEIYQRAKQWRDEHSAREILEVIDRVLLRPPDRDADGGYKCPMCAHPLGPRGRGYGGYMDYEKFCPRCAQRIDWNRIGIHPGWGKYTFMAMTGTVGYVDKED